MHTNLGGFLEGNSFTKAVCPLQNLTLVPNTFVKFPINVLGQEATPLTSKYLIWGVHIGFVAIAQAQGVIGQIILRRKKSTSP